MAEFVIGDFTFPTKREAAAQVRRALNDSPLDTPLVGPDYELLGALLGLHPSAEDKIGPGVAHIEVRRIDYGARAFWVVRTDGTSRDFSYIKCLNGARSPQAEAKVAMRWAIQPDIDRFRREELHRLRTNGLALVCELTGNPIGDGPDTHVDHYGIEFAELAEKFAAGYGGLRRIFTRPSPRHVGPEIADDAVFDAWVAFHREHATLRLLSAAANLTRYRRH